MIKKLPKIKRDAIQARLKEERAHIRIIKKMNIFIQIVKNFNTNLKHHDVVKLSIIFQKDRSLILIQTMMNVLISNSQFGFIFFACANHDSRH